MDISTLEKNSSLFEKLVAEGWISKYSQTRLSKSKRKIPIQSLPINKDNYFESSEGTFKELSKIPPNFVRHFKSKGSEYFLNEDATQLIRKSDHWGRRIRFCSWFIRGFPRIDCRKWKAMYGVKIGVINFSDLSPNTDFLKGEKKVKGIQSRWPE